MKSYEVDETTKAIDESLKEMERTPESNIAMCHAQGKSAVYLSRDGRFIVTHSPEGAISAKTRIGREA